MSVFDVPMAERVRVEITMRGVTYEFELAPADDVDLHAGELRANLRYEVDTVTREADGGWRETLPTGWATVQLSAHGKLVKAERRSADGG